MKKITFFITLSLLAVCLFSCEDNENDPPAADKTALITAHTWKLSAATISPAYNGQTDIFALQPCYQDNFESYAANCTLTKNEGSSICSPYQTVTTGDWSFNSTESVVQFSYDDESLPDESYNLLELTDNTLRYSGMLEMNGVNYTLTFNFIAQ